MNALSSAPMVTWPEVWSLLLDWQRVHVEAMKQAAAGACSLKGYHHPGLAQAPPDL
jgi:hypothetical protein